MERVTARDTSQGESGRVTPCGAGSIAASALRQLLVWRGKRTANDTPAV